jgi:hypothetical protein
MRLRLLCRGMLTLGRNGRTKRRPLQERTGWTVLGALFRKQRTPVMTVFHHYRTSVSMRSARLLA